MNSEIKPTVINERDSAESSNPSQEFPQPRRLARRSFLRNLGMGAALLAPGAALLGNANKALGGLGDRRHLPDGDVAILKLLAAVELIEEDLWQQYNELGGVDAPDSGYKAGLVILDGHQPLRDAGSESKQLGSVTNPPQYRGIGDHAFPDLAGQGRQCDSVDRF